MGDPSSWLDVFGLAERVPTQTPSMATPVGNVPTRQDIQNIADNTQKILPEGSQGYKTTGAGYAIDANGNGYIIVASSDKHLSPAQRDSLDLSKGELRASGKGHAETTIAKYASDNKLTLVAVAASRPVCGGCQVVLDQQEVDIISERKPIKCNGK
ncbi:hypothetical protein SAMN05444275_10526 [Myroides odoratimimus subsp. xuanwuensis]|nr:hypothetical protein SAMN05444275_10526 [Myroides odoratimimus subsp. xuanwuensis]